MDISIHNSSGEIISKVRLSDSVFKIKPNDDVIFRAVMSENTNSRQGTSSTKTRSEVSGGGKNHGSKKEEEQLEQVQLDHPFGKVVELLMVQNQKIISMICQKK